jgi:hypothetical protein
MATERQIEANRANAQKSTGPQTPEGKAKSSMNRLTHGFFSPSAIIPGEDGAILMALINDLKAEFEPATTTEEILVEKMAQAQWLTQRALNLQGEAFAKESAVPKNLGLLIRYHSTAERAFHKAHNELVKTQKEREKSEIGFVPQKPADPLTQTPPELRKTVPDVITEDFIMNEPDLDLVEEALGIFPKAA